jgi:hypothetical protein
VPLFHQCLRPGDLIFPFPLLLLTSPQNATLAGGVAIGAIANLTLAPATVSLVGAVAGLVSVLGFKFIQPWLEDKIALHDTCGACRLYTSAHFAPFPWRSHSSILVFSYVGPGHVQVSTTCTACRA